MTEETKFLNIGLVMPIAPIDGCSTDHWMDVKRIITEAVSSMPGYSSDPKIVSEGNSSGLIHKRIVEGLYKSDIIICDVSCKNPNVMFELGMRLAFDKPTIIIKDDKTDYTFDAGVIEHLQYPRDLRYKSIVEFKESLSEKVRATYEDSKKDANHSPFLKSFGTFKIAELKESEVSSDQFIIKTLKDIQYDMREIKRSSPKNSLERVIENQKRVVVLSNLKDLIKDLERKSPSEETIYDLSAVTKLLHSDLKFSNSDLSIFELEAIIENYFRDSGLAYI